jgi:hypothetical protein
LIVLAVLLLAAPAMAAEWNFYGSSRFATWSTNVDMDVSGVGDDTDTIWKQQGNSRIGANIKFNDQIGGRFEYGAGDNINKRHLYGTYNFGVGEVLIGQTYTPTSGYFYSNSVMNKNDGDDEDGNLLGIGQFYVGRRSMIQLKFGDSKFGDLKLAFVEFETDDRHPIDPITVQFDPSTGQFDYDYGYGYGYGYDMDTTFPKIELSYGYKGEMFFVDVFGGFQTYEINFQNGSDEDVDAYVAGIGTGVNVGPASFRAGFHIGQNFGNYGQWNQAIDYFGEDYFNDKATPDPNGGLEDSDGLGWLAVVSFTANDMLTFEAGYGYEESELDDLDYKAEIEQYYLNATIHIHKNFFVVPEVGMVEYQEDGQGARTEEPDVFYAGAKWQINF